MRFSIAVDEMTGVAEQLERALTENKVGGLRTTSEALLGEILDTWLASTPSPEEDDRANVAHLEEI